MLTPPTFCLTLAAGDEQVYAHVREKPRVLVHDPAYAGDAPVCFDLVPDAVEPNVFTFSSVLEARFVQSYIMFWAQCLEYHFNTSIKVSIIKKFNTAVRRRKINDCSLYSVSHTHTHVHYRLFACSCC
jgi:hypothetical protein